VNALLAADVYLSEDAMPHLEQLQHSVVWHQPESIDEIVAAWDKAVEHFHDEGCAAYVAGWWQEQVHGHIVYPIAQYEISGIDGDWFLTENRKHRVTLLEGNPGAVCAVEFVPHDRKPSFRYTLADLERDSPLGFGPTRMRPGWDIIGCDDPRPYRQDSEIAPEPETLQSLQRTANGAILPCPVHTIEIDRVWHWLVQAAGLIAEHDIEAYVIGWWQERDFKGGPHGVVNLAFATPQRLWGFHHPPGAPNARWMYLDNWPIDVKPLPASAGAADWAVEFVRRGESPTLTTWNLMQSIPVRKVDGIPARSSASDPTVLTAGDVSKLSPIGRAVVSQPLPVLAGLCGLKDRSRIIAFAWACATWVTAHPVAQEEWPAAHCRFWAFLWQSGQRKQYV
jgi:hypothetical protein